MTRKIVSRNVKMTRQVASLYGELEMTRQVASLNNELQWLDNLSVRTVK